MVYLDTHVVVWLYAGEINLISPAARAIIDREGLLISPAVQLELQYLKETDRITVDSSLIFETLAQSIGLAMCEQPFVRVVLEAVHQNWTRDPFDRLIVAQAALGEAVLISKDRLILKHYSRGVW